MRSLTDHHQQNEAGKKINSVKSRLIAQYLLNVCDEISRKISGLVVEHTIDPALLQIIFTHNLYDVTLLEVKKSRLGAHVII